MTHCPVPCHQPPALSGARFEVDYRLQGAAAEARRKAEDICLEQTVEFPGELVPTAIAAAGVVGRVESLRAVSVCEHEATISFAIETASGGRQQASGGRQPLELHADLPQLLNVIYGNVSLKPGIRVERFRLGDQFAAALRGPRFGRQGLRELLGVPRRPLLCTALKPMGLSNEDLAALAYTFAIGGVDLIKDDHGLSDQPFTRFDDRVARCAEAVARANAQTGQRCLYLPNVTAGPGATLDRARLARRHGAGGLLVSPALCGFDTMRALADADDIALPILSHPAFQGSFVASPTDGISHFALFGQLVRLAGGDGSIFPNYGGRFSFTRQQCVELAAGTCEPMGSLRPIFPVPAGGMTLDNVADMRDVYGSELILLVGGGLFRHGPDLIENCRIFRRLAEGF